MNILYITNLSGNQWAGPSVCVPDIIKSQSEYDSVLWYNMNQRENEYWRTLGVRFENLNSFPSGRLRNLPIPFNHPDIVIIQEIYAHPFRKIISDIINSRIPYIVVPHSQLTYMAQRQKRLKKTVANQLWFNKMVRRASAVQYLSIGERQNSEKQFKTQSYIVPNGTSVQPIVRDAFDVGREIRATYIGRLDIYQKGLDYLIQAVAEMKDELCASGFHLELYGPSPSGEDENIAKLILEYGVSDLVHVSGSIFGEEKKKVLLSTDVFVMASRFEGHSLGLIEALSFGIPCIACDGTYMVDEIAEYGAGWCGESSKDGVINALRLMLGDKDQFGIKGRRAKKLADTYSWKSIAKKNHQIYQTIIDEGRI